MDRACAVSEQTYIPTGRFLEYGFSATGGTAVLVVGHERNVASVKEGGREG